MPIKMTCRCGKTLVLPDEAAGQKGKCPACGEVMVVPAARAAAEEVTISAEPVPTPEPPPTRPFIEEAMLAFRYPVSVGGAVSLVIAAGALTLLGYVPFVILAWAAWFFALGYIAAYFLSVVQSSAGGDPKMPESPDFGDYVEEVLKPIGWMISVIFISMLPQGIYGIYAWQADVPLNSTVLSVMSVYSVLYFPMAVMSVAIWRSVAAVSPHIVIPTILKIPGQHLMMSASVWLIWQAYKHTHAQALSWVLGPKPGMGSALLAMFVTQFVLLYFMCVIGRVIGITHWIYRKKIGWFTSM